MKRIFFLVVALLALSMLSVAHADHYAYFAQDPEKQGNPPASPKRNYD
jgi:hypothetical protein